MTFTKILVPYDDSKYSKKAFEKTVKIAEKFSSTIFLLNVIKAEQSRDHIITSTGKLEDIHDRQIAEAENMLEKLRINDNVKNISIRREVMHDPSPSKGIISFADTNNVDLIVMGSHGRTGLKKLVLGSVASDVVTNSKCNVLIIKENN